MAALWLVLYVGDPKSSPFKVVGYRRCGFLIADLRLLAVNTGKFCGERDTILLRFNTHHPVRHGNESTYLALTLNQKTQRHGLNTSSGKETSV